MKYKIVADSACNIVSGEDSTFASVPMKIVAEREYLDDANLDVAQMVEYLKQYNVVRLLLPQCGGVAGSLR